MTIHSKTVNHRLVRNHAASPVVGILLLALACGGCKKGGFKSVSVQTLEKRLLAREPGKLCAAEAYLRSCWVTTEPECQKLARTGISACVKVGVEKKGMPSSFGNRNALTQWGEWVSRCAEGAVTHALTKRIPAPPQCEGQRPGENTFAPVTAQQLHQTVLARSPAGLCGVKSQLQHCRVTTEKQCLERIRYHITSCFKSGLAKGMPKTFGNAVDHGKWRTWLSECARLRVSAGLPKKSPLPAGCAEK